MKTHLFAVTLLSLLSLKGLTQTSITVDVGKRLKVLHGRENGINLNYLMDGGFTAPATHTAAALKSMGMKLLRYPGGEKSDNYLWSAAPWTKAAPRMALRDTANAWPTEDGRFVDKASPEKLAKQVVLDFDELMTLCNTAGAEPLIVVAYDAMYNTLTADRPTKQQLIANAVEWVRYANITKKFGIKYWMIGNESWYQPDYNGRTTAAQYAADLTDFATAMKAVDPSIKIIANGQNSWWPTLLQSPAVALVDILAFSLYPAHGFTNGYENYRTSNQSVTSEVDDAVRAINTYAPAAHRARLKVLAAEYNSIDFDDGWSNENNLGHALFNFQMFGDMVVNPKVEGACLWNTRWTTNQTEEQHLFDALDKNGGLNASGTAQQVWGTNLLNTMVTASSTSNQVKVYASYDTVTKNLNLFLLNKDTDAKTVNLSIAGYAANYRGARYVFRGASVNDKFPAFSRTDTVAHPFALSPLILPAASVTVLKLAAAPETPASLVSFSGSVGSNDVQLEWQVQNDFNLLQYEVEKGSDSSQFTRIGTVPVRNESTQTATYRYLDSAFVPDAPNYYRLKLVGRNGQIRYSNVLRFELPSDSNAMLVTIAPNPVESRLQVQVVSGRAQEITFRIVDAVGRAWASEKVQVGAGRTIRTLSNLPAQRGIYWLQAQGDGVKKTVPFLKK